MVPSHALFVTPVMVNVKWVISLVKALKRKKISVDYSYDTPIYNNVEFSTIGVFGDAYAEKLRDLIQFFIYEMEFQILIIG